MKKPSKVKRVAMLKQQDNTCPICKTPHDKPDGMCYVPEQNALICRSCSAYLSSYKWGIAHNVTPGMLTAFTNQAPAPDPTPPEPTAQARRVKPKKPTYAQLHARWRIATGQILFDPGLLAHDGRTGITGPVTHPDTGEPIGIMEYSGEYRTYGMSLGCV